MAKMNIQITKENHYGEQEKIVNIDIKNGNWKYWDRYCKGEEKQTLTINNVHDMTIINQPVKDALAYHDIELFKETGKLKMTCASVRTYDNLLSYLNCRINNAKDDYKKWGYTERRYTAVLFEEEFYLTKDETAIRDITFECKGLIEITIKVLE